LKAKVNTTPKISLTEKNKDKNPNKAEDHKKEGNMLENKFNITLKIMKCFMLPMITIQKGTLNNNNTMT